MGGRRGLLLLALATYAFFSSVMAITSIIARYSRHLGYSIEATGLMFSLTPLAASLLRLPVGVAADRLGGRLFIVLGSLLASAAAVAALSTSSLEGLMAARALQGAALAFFVAPSIYAASVLQGVPPARAIAVRSAAIAAASSTAPYIAGFLVDYAGYRAGFSYAALSGLLAATSSALLPIHAPAAKGNGGGWRVLEVLRHARMLIPLFAASALDGIVFLGFQSLPQANLRDLGYPASVFGLALALNGAAGVPFRLYASKLSPSLGCIAGMALGYSLAVMGMGLLWRSVTPPWIHVVGLLYGAGLGLVVPSEQLIIVSTVPEKVRNTLLSIYTLFFDVGGFLGSTLLGALAEAQGYAAGYAAMLLSQLSSLILVALWGLRVGFRRCRLEG